MLNPQGRRTGPLLLSAQHEVWGQQDVGLTDTVSAAPCWFKAQCDGSMLSWQPLMCFPCARSLVSEHPSCAAEHALRIIKPHKGGKYNQLGRFETHLLRMLDTGKPPEEEQLRSA